MGLLGPPRSQCFVIFLCGYPIAFFFLGIDRRGSAPRIDQDTIVLLPFLFPFLPACNDDLSLVPFTTDFLRSYLRPSFFLPFFSPPLVVSPVLDFSETLQRTS